MGKPVRIDAEAEQEITEAIDWYESKRPGLGSDFLDEIRTAIRSLQEPGPECGPIRGIPPELGVRRKLIQRFPYAVIFIEFDTAVRVIAVAHGHRRPRYWRRRV
jgi:plasmid stabilization system protein ParE